MSAPERVRRAAPLALFVLAYAWAEIVLVRSVGIDNAEQHDVAAFVYVLLSLATWYFTRARNARDAGAREARPRALGWQVAIVAAIALLTALVGAAFNGAVPFRLPAEFLRLAVYGVPQFVEYVVVPALLLAPFGVRPRDVWVRRGERGWIVAGATWAAPFAVALALGAVQNPASLGRLASRVLSNVFKNGFSEEFLFRGVLLTRLRYLMDDGWALFAQALVFGAWHYGADMRQAHGNLTYAIALMIATQASFGYAIGFLALRSRSLLFPSIAHALEDAF